MGLSPITEIRFDFLNGLNILVPQNRKALTMAKLSLPSLKKHLNDKSKDELVKEICEFYKKFPSVNDYYKNFLTERGRNEVLSKYKKIINDEFLPSRGIGKLNLKVARKAISDFKKISTSCYDIADVMIYYVELGVYFSNLHDQVSENFYLNMEIMFDLALQYIQMTKQEEKFNLRCKIIVDNALDMGCGFHDCLSDSFAEYFGDM